MPVGDAKKLVQYCKDQYKKAKQNNYTKSYNTFVNEMGWGAGLDIHKLIGKVPKTKAGWTPGSYKYMGPYNPLDEQLTYDPKTGEVLQWKVKPYNKIMKQQPTMIFVMTWGTTKVIVTERWSSQ